MAYSNNYFPVGYQPAQIIYPQQNTQAQAQQTQTSMIWIQGEAAAKSYLVAPNTSVALWDSESPTVYVKSTDASGIPSMRIFDYTERTAKPKEEVKIDYATKDDISALRDEINHLKESMKAKKEKKNES